MTIHRLRAIRCTVTLTTTTHATITCCTVTPTTSRDAILELWCDLIPQAGVGVRVMIRVGVSVNRDSTSTRAKLG